MTVVDATVVEVFVVVDVCVINGVYVNGLRSKGPAFSLECGNVNSCYRKRMAS